MEAWRDEIMALSAILDEEELVLKEDSNEGEIKIHVDITDEIEILVQQSEAGPLSADKKSSVVKLLPPMLLKFQYDKEYPYTKCLGITLNSAWMTKECSVKLEHDLRDLFHPGEVVLFDMYTLLKCETQTFVEDCGGTLLVDTDEALEEIIAYNMDNGGVKTCQVCYDDVPMTLFVRLRACGHEYCQECIGAHCSACLRDAQAGSGIGCPDPDCDQVLDIQDVKEAIDEETFEKYDKTLLEIAIRKTGNLTWCPNLSCQHPAEVDYTRLFNQQHFYLSYNCRS